ncbi:MAG: signal peptidase I [Nitrososphaeria archaeon]
MGNFLNRHRKKIEIAEDIVLVLLFSSLIILLATIILGISPFFYVEGISMHPTLEDGDLIIIDRTDYDNLKVGDIIVFNSSIYHFRIVHRIVDVRSIDGEKVFITQGDNTHAPDPSYVGKENYVGRYVNIRIPYAGFIGEALAPPVNYIIIVLLIMYLIYVDFYLPRKNKQQPSNGAQKQPIL